MTDPDPEQLTREWAARLSAALGVMAPREVEELLSLAGAIAHRVVRPAAPITTYLVGYADGLAAGRSGPDAAVTAAELAATFADDRAS